MLRAVPLVIALAIGTQAVLLLPELPGRADLIIKAAWLATALGLIVWKAWRAIVERRHLWLARFGIDTAAAPPAYVRWLFDDYAGRYDEELRAKLSYQVPELLRDVTLAHVPESGLAAVDLGCGTGLTGVALRDRVTSLVGVDLSPRMLSVAASRGVYDELVESDLIHYLRARPGEYGLCVAADVLCYRGDLAPVMEACAEALRPDGHFAFTVERGQGPQWTLQRTGRYRHSRTYVEEVARRCGFDVVESRDGDLRTEHDLPVSGIVFLLRRGEGRGRGASAAAIRSRDVDPLSNTGAPERLKSRSDDHHGAFLVGPGT